MSQVTTGLRSILGNPAIYDAFQSIMGSAAGRRDLIKAWLRPVSGMRILDIGCGTARILDHLPEVDYYGFDLSERYIEAATHRYSDRGHFRCARVEEALLDHLPRFELVFASGVLHHLGDDEALRLFDLAKTALEEAGRLVTIDPCFDPDQNSVARYLVSRDRGQNVRTADQYRDMARRVFSRVNGKVRHQTWIPYTHWIMECVK